MYRTVEWKNCVRAGGLRTSERKIQKEKSTVTALKYYYSFHSNRPLPSCFEPCYESKALCIVFIRKISFHSHAIKTNFHMKSFALSLAFIMRYKTTRKRPIQGVEYSYSPSMGCNPPHPTPTTPKPMHFVKSPTG